MSKGACITKMGTVRNYNTNTIMEKNKQEGGGGEVLRIWNIEYSSFRL